MKKFKLLTLLLLVPGLGHASEFNFSYIMSHRASYFFNSESEDSASGFGFFGNKSKDAGRSVKFQPYGAEVGGIWDFHEMMAVNASFRWTPFEQRLARGEKAQDGHDLMATLLYQVNFNHFGTAVGVRTRHFIIEKGPIPNSGHAGLLAQFIYDNERLQLLVEAGLMALGIGTTKEFGKQRDASSLRLRAEYAFDWNSYELSPFIEFFHLHRSYFNSKLMAGEKALFVDEPALNFGLKLAI